MSNDTIDKLQQRYAKFSKQQIRVGAQLEAQKRLSELQSQAKKDFGTDDVDALQEKLQAMKKENEKKQAEYQKGLDEVEAKLKEVEAEFAETEVEDGSFMHPSPSLWEGRRSRGGRALNYFQWKAAITSPSPLTRTSFTTLPEGG